MRLWRAMAGAGLAMLAAQPAKAAAGDWTRCTISHGVLLVPAKAGGLTGPFVLDAATAHSVIDATQASLVGLPDAGATLAVRVAGLRIPALSFAVAALDARTRVQPTPVTGVLGADVLQGRVLEVWPSPCRLRIGVRASAMGRPTASLPVDRRADTPLVTAAVADNARAVRGAFRIATGGDVDVRLSPALAAYKNARGNANGLTAPLRALSVGPWLIENPQAAVAEAATPGVAGEIGEPVWARYGLRLDLRRGRLELFDPEQQRTRRRRSGGS